VTSERRVGERRTAARRASLIPPKSASGRLAARYSNDSAKHGFATPIGRRLICGQIIRELWRPEFPDYRMPWAASPAALRPADLYALLVRLRPALRRLVRSARQRENRSRERQTARWPGWILSHARRYKPPALDSDDPVNPGDFDQSSPSLRQRAHQGSATAAPSRVGSCGWMTAPRAFRRARTAAAVASTSVTRPTSMCSRKGCTTSAAAQACSRRRMSAAVSRPAMRIRVLSPVRLILMRAIEEYSSKKGSNAAVAENRSVWAMSRG
jgi:hypothetical protein